MGTESRRGLGRIAHPPVADRVARHANLPVVFVPPMPKLVAPATVPGIFTVLAPTDLSEAGNRAIPFAYALLGGHGGVVELCHVHAHPLRSPSEVRRALAYVLLNFRKHLRAAPGIDPCSSGIWFEGWARPASVRLTERGARSMSGTRLD